MTERERLLAANDAIAKDRDDARAELARARAALVAVTEADCCGCSVYGAIAKAALADSPPTPGEAARTVDALKAELLDQTGAAERAKARAIEAWDEVARLRAELQRICQHPTTFDTMPASCCTCGKEIA